MVKHWWSFTLNNKRRIRKSIRDNVHEGNLGSSGSGKTFGVEARAEDAWRAGVKVIKIGDDQKIEGMGFIRPPLGMPEFLKKLQRYAVGQAEKYKVSPKPFPGIPTEFYHPILFSEMFPDKAPECFHFYTLPFKIFQDSRLVSVYQGSANSSSTLNIISSIAAQFKKSDSFPTAINLLGKHRKAHRRVTIIEGRPDTDMLMDAPGGQAVGTVGSFMESVMASGIFSSEKFPYALSDEKIMKILSDPEKISVFTNYWLFGVRGGEALSRLINFYLLTRIWVIARDLGIDVLVIIDDAERALSGQIGDVVGTMATQARKSGVHLELSFQNPKQLHQDVWNSLGCIRIFRFATRLDDYTNYIGATFKNFLKSDHWKQMSAMPVGTYFTAGNDSKKKEFLNIPNQKDDNGYELRDKFGRADFKLKFTDHVRLPETKAEIKLMSWGGFFGPVIIPWVDVGMYDKDRSAFFRYYQLHGEYPQKSYLKPAFPVFDSSEYVKALQNEWADDSHRYKKALRVMEEKEQVKAVLADSNLSPNQKRTLDVLYAAHKADPKSLGLRLERIRIEGNFNDKKAVVNGLQNLIDRKLIFKDTSESYTQTGTNNVIDVFYRILPGGIALIDQIEPAFKGVGGVGDFQTTTGVGEELTTPQVEPPVEGR